MDIVIIFIWVSILYLELGIIDIVYSIVFFGRYRES